MTIKVFTVSLTIQFFYCLKLIFSQFPEKGKVWYCIAKTNYKNLPINSISFSQDGSLLASGIGNTLCVWTSENLKLKCALSAPAGLDGSANKVLISVSDPNEKKLSTKQKSVLDKRKKMLEQIKQLVEKGDQSLFKNVTSEKKRFIKSEKCAKLAPNDLKVKEQELIFKRIMNLQELNLYQKFELFSNLGICCRAPGELKFDLLKFLTNKKNDQTNLSSKIDKAVAQLSSTYKFTAKGKLHEYQTRRKLWNRQNNHKNASINQILSFGDNPKKNSQEKLNGNSDVKHVNGVCAGKDSVTEIITPIKTIAQINHVLFCTGEFAHLAIICTENRLLIWNLLTLRLQTTLKLSVNKITIDPYTSLVAAFTIYNERKFIS